MTTSTYHSNRYLFSAWEYLQYFQSDMYLVGVFYYHETSQSPNLFQFILYVRKFILVFFEPESLEEFLFNQKT